MPPKKLPLLSTLLVYAPITPPSLIEHLKTIFETVLYFPLPPFSPTAPDPAALPTPEQLESVTVLLSFTVPHNVLSRAQLPNLQLFQALSAGTGHITGTPFFKSLDKEKDSDLVVASASGIHVSTIAEHVVGTVLALWHKLHTLIWLQRRDEEWANSRALFGNAFVREIRGSTVGIIGYGHIGRETARLFKPFGAKILALNRSGKASPETGFTLPNTGDLLGDIPEAYFSTQDEASLKAFYEESDVIVNCLPGSAETQNFVGERELRWAKGDAILVNIGRGETVDSEALLKALQTKALEGEAADATGTLRIGGASLDVTAPEPLPPKHPLWSLDNVIITPHTSGNSIHYFENGVTLLEKNLERLGNNEGGLGAVFGNGSS